MQRHSNLPLKFRKKLPITSLQAAICNVALFKNMKQKQFRDQIFISYCDQGVLLDAYSQQDWNQACLYTQNFLKKKKIALLTYGYQRQAYQQLIIKGLKQFTRKIKEKRQECPYINIIHYQKLRKSCQYMDKEKYSDPLKDWQKKNKSKPNFAFLIVEPRVRFQQVKRSLLQFLFEKPVPLQVAYLSPLQFVYTFFNSPSRAILKQSFMKYLIQTSIIQKQNSIQKQKPILKTQKQSQEDQNSQLTQIPYKKIIRIANYTDTDIQQYQIYPMKNNKNIAKLGLQFLSSNQIKNQSSNIKSFIRQGNSQNLFEKMHQSLILQFGQNYALIPYKKCEKQKSLQLINKFTNLKYTKQEIYMNLKKYVVCQYNQIQFIEMISQGNIIDTKIQDDALGKQILSPKMGKNQSQQMSSQSQKTDTNKANMINISQNIASYSSSSNNYIIHKVSINGCPFMLHQYSYIKQQDLDTFLIYLQQLFLYYNNYMVRFYGISIHPKKQSCFYLIFDYQSKNLKQMLQHGQIIDDCQIGTMILQILYLLRYLHTHQQPRCIGKLVLNQIYWPLCIVLPYLSAENQENTIEGDIKLVGQCMKQLLGDQKSQDFQDISLEMLKENKYDRITLSKCISRFEELLQI